MMLILRYWKPLAIALLLIAAAAIWHITKQRAYQEGYSAGYREASVKITAKLAKVEQIQRQQMQTASQHYQEEKAKREEKERVRYVEVQKIIEKPIYHNNCLDDDGLHQLNAAITDSH